MRSLLRRGFNFICSIFFILFQTISQPMKDLCVEVINRMFGLLGFFETLWRLFWEVVFPPKYLKNVDGQVILIAGVTSLSQGLAKRLAKRGAKLVFWDSNGDLLEDLSNEYDAEDMEIIVQTVKMDSYAEVQKAAEYLSDHHKIEIDILVNATEIGHQVDWLKQEPEYIDEMINTNFKSCLWLTRTFIPKFIEKHSGHIVTISSTAAVTPTPHICEYSASQAGVVAFMKSVEVDMLARGLNEIHFTTLCPSFVQSEFFKDAKFSGKSLWDRIELDEASDAMLNAVLTNQHLLIVPWQDNLLSSLQMILSPVSFYKVLARRWQYPQSN